MSQSSSSSSSGIGFVGLLTILFVGLKLSGHIDWSWWLVTAPIWGVFALIGIILIIVGAVVLIFESKK